MNIQQIDQKIKELETKKQELMEKQKTEKTIIIKELGIEVETKLHLDMNIISKLQIPIGWRLLTLSEWIFIYNNYKNEIDYGGNPDELVSQPIKEKETEYPYWNVWFRSLVRSGLNGYNWDLPGDFRLRGVRFCRDLKNKVKQ